jgi:H+/gluconate symporter-like permease
MPSIVRSMLDVLIPVALTAAVAFVIVVSSHFLVAHGNGYQGITVWFSFIRRPDIIATIALTAVVTFGYQAWQRGRLRK